MQSRQPIFSWARQGVLTGDIGPALALVDPQPGQWRMFIGQLLLLVGVISLACGVIFFFAYNWAELGRLSRFALVGLALLLTALVYWRYAWHVYLAKALLLLQSLLLGALLALIGQTYQTGADPWQLFALWAGLMLPWAVISASTMVWGLWVVVVNVAVSLSIETFHGLLGVPLGHNQALLVYAGVNTLLLALFEMLALRHYLANRVLAQLTAIAAGGALTLFAIWQIVDPRQWLGPLCWLIWMAGYFAAYRYWRLDLLLLAGWALSGIAVTCALLIEHLHQPLDEGIFLLASLLGIGLSTLTVVWLKRLLQHPDHAHPTALEVGDE